MNNLFEQARVAWRVNGGIVNGHDPEYKNLVKVCKAEKLDIDLVIPLLLSAVESYFAYCRHRKTDGVFCEPPSSFTVYINNQRWMREYPTSQTNKPKQRKCFHCGNTDVVNKADFKPWRCWRSECKTEYEKL